MSCDSLLTVKGLDWSCVCVKEVCNMVQKRK